MQIRFAAFLFICLFAGLFALTVDRPTHAATTLPTKMNFQGRVTNSAGNILANGTYNMKFKIWSAASGGTLQWSEDRLVSAGQGVTVSNGQFSVQLGSVTSLPASVFASNSLYFEVELPTPASATTSSPVWTEGAMTPRNQMATSAYAYNSETLDGLDSAMFGQLGTSNTWTETNLFKPTTNGTATFEVQTTASVSVLRVDTQNLEVRVETLSALTAGSLNVGSVRTSIDPYSTGGGTSAIALGADGFARMTYRTADGLEFTRCTNADCTTKNVTVIGNVFSFDTSLAIGSDGYARIARFISGSGIEFIQCTNNDCTTRNTTVIDSGNSANPSLAMGSDGYARIAYQDGDDLLKFVQCTNDECSTNNTTTIDGAVSIDTPSLAMGSDGYARIAYTDATNDDTLKFAQCTNAACTTNATTTVDADPWHGFYPSLAMGSDGYARIVYLEYDSTGYLKFLRCTNADCTTNSITDVVTSEWDTGAASLAMGSDGYARITYENESQQSIDLLQCTNADCSVGNVGTVEGVDSARDYSQIRIGADGYPRIFYQTASGFKYARLTTVTGNEEVSGASLGTVPNGFGEVFAKAINLQGGLNIDNTGRNGGAIQITGGGNYMLGFDSSGVQKIKISDATLSYNTSSNETAVRIDNNGSVFSNSSTSSGSAGLYISKTGNGAGLSVTRWAGGTGNLAEFNMDCCSDPVFALNGTTGAAIFRNLTDSANGFTVQNASGANLFNVNTSTAAVAIAADTTISAGKSLTVTGGNTASRPASPAEGMVYYDTDTKKLEVYSNGKWQADRAEAVIVAASNSSQADKDAADYVADGNTGAAADGDQVQINTALTAASGKKVVLLAGTYVADATILIPNNTTLMGVGKSTIIELADLDVADNLIENSDTSTGANITIRDLQLNGRKDLNTAGTQRGIHLTGMGGGTGATARQGALVTGVFVTSFRSENILLTNASNNVISDSTAQASSAEGLQLSSGSNNNIITGSKFQGNSASGFNVNTSSSSNNITSNHAQGNGSAGFSLASGSYNTASSNTSIGNGYGFFITSSTHTITANIVQGNSSGGFYSSGSNNTLTGNTANGGSYGFDIGGDNNNVTGNTTQGTSYGIIITGDHETVSGNNVMTSSQYGIHLNTTNNSVVSGNKIHDSGGTTTNNGIYISTSDSNSVTGNSITDISATTNNYAVNISNATSDTNYVANNSLGSGSVNDAGTDTVYANQLNSSGQLINRSTGGFAIQGTAGTNLFSTAGTASVTIGTSDTTGTVLVLDTKTDAGDPTGIAGGMYYNSNAGKFRCYQAGAWKSCEDGGNATTLEGIGSGGFGQIAADNTFTGGNAFNGATFSIGGTANAAKFNVAGLFNVDSSASRVSIGTSDTTGTVLVLDTKTNAGDPTGVDGAMYYNSSTKSFRCYQDGQWRSCIGGLVATSTTTSSVSNTTTEINFAENYTIPANNCIPGRVYRVLARGVYRTATLQPNITIRLKAGSTVLAATASVSPAGSANNRQWTAEADVICQTVGVSGSVEAAGEFSWATSQANANNAEMPNSATVALDTTVAQTLQLSAQWSGAGVDNSITLRQFTVESLGP